MSEPHPGPRNLITDVEGLMVGQAEDLKALTGVTVLLPEAGGMVAAVDVRGGAPGTRETDALDPTCIVEEVHAVVLSGGSVFGLDAASGVTSWLAARGIGFRFRDQPLACPVVPAAVLFDITNGGDKAWGAVPPYRALGIAACEAATRDFALGNAGAGLGATAGMLKGGLGSASLAMKEATVGALVAVNSFGSGINPRTGELWAQAFAHGEELGGERGKGSSASRFAGTKADRRASETGPGGNTTLAVVATDAVVSRAEARRIAIMAANGMARALRPLHTPFDGDVVFAVSTGRRALPEPRLLSLSRIGTAAGDCLSRAIGRAKWEAGAVAGWRSYRDTLAADDPSR